MCYLLLPFLGLPLLASVLLAAEPESTPVAEEEVSPPVAPIAPTEAETDSEPSGESTPPQPSGPQSHEEALAALADSHHQLAAAQKAFAKAKGALESAEEIHNQAHEAELATRTPNGDKKQVEAPEIAPVKAPEAAQPEVSAIEKRAAELKQRADKVKKLAEEIQEAAED